MYRRCYSTYKLSHSGTRTTRPSFLPFSLLPTACHLHVALIKVLFHQHSLLLSVSFLSLFPSLTLCLPYLPSFLLSFPLLSYPFLSSPHRSSFLLTSPPLSLPTHFSPSFTLTRSPLDGVTIATTEEEAKQESKSSGSAGPMDIDGTDDGSS